MASTTNIRIDSKSVFTIGQSTLNETSVIDVSGADNTVTIGNNVKGKVLIKVAGTGSQVLIDDDVNIMGVLNIIIMRGHSTVRIKKASSFMGLVRLFNHEPSSIEIGEDCMFAGEILVTTSDMHPVFDADTDARINPALPIVIGDHVWVGMGVSILKGVTLGSGSVAGMSSLVTRGVYPEKCVIAGNPARVVRENIRWDRNLPMPSPTL